MKAVSHMSRFVDPRAPTEADSTELAAIQANPDVLQLKELRESLSREVRHLIAAAVPIGSFPTVRLRRMALTPMLRRVSTACGVVTNQTIRRQEA
jgi:hypothetical protein